MDDDRKKPPRGKPASAGAGGPGKGRGPSGDRKFGKPAGERSFQSRDGKPFAKKPFVRKDREQAAEGEGQRERKPFVRREDGGAEKPFRKSFGDRPQGDRKPFEKREGGGDRPFKKPFARRDDSATGGEERPFRKSFGERPQGDRKPFEKREGGGDRPFKKPFVRRDDAAASGKDRPFRKSFGDKPRGDRKPFEKREGGDRPFRRPAPRADDPQRASGAEAESGERIAKRLARAGIASRRDAEELIAAGRIRVNGKVLESPAFNVSAADRIELDGELIPAPERTRLFLFHKPGGLVTTNRDPEGRRTVFDVLPEGLPRLMTVGRLDINTEGLLLLTNDGGLARVMELPATGWLRRYRVRVHGTVDEKSLANLRDGVAVDGVFYGAVEAQLDREQGSNAWLTIGLREGKNREVKNILGSLGLDVTRLIRISYGPFQLGELPEGHVMEIKGRMLRDQLGERLIEEANANFEADISTPFPNRPVRRGDEHKAADRAPRERRETVREGEGGLIKNFRRDKDRKRTDNLDRWSTSRDGDAPRFRKRDDDAAPRKSFGEKPRFGDKPRSGGKDRDSEREGLSDPGQRRANVWMAPGARPQGKRPSERTAEKRGDARPPRKSDGMGGERPFSGKPRPTGGGKPGGRPGGRPAGKPRGGKS